VELNGFIQGLELKTDRAVEAIIAQVELTDPLATMRVHTHDSGSILFAAMNRGADSHEFSSGHALVSFDSGMFCGGFTHVK
jgi:hypothetical protein